MRQHLPYRAHVINIFLRTARGGKVNFLRDFWKANPKFEAVQIDDVATDDFTDALKGMGS